MEKEGVISAWRNRRGKRVRWESTGNSLEWEGGGQVGDGTVGVGGQGFGSSGCGDERCGDQDGAHDPVDVGG